MRSEDFNRKYFLRFCSISSNLKVNFTAGLLFFALPTVLYPSLSINTIFFLGSLSYFIFNFDTIEFWLLIK